MDLSGLLKDTGVVVGGGKVIIAYYVKLFPGKG